MTTTLHKSLVGFIEQQLEAGYGYLPESQIKPAGYKTLSISTKNIIYKSLVTTPKGAHVVHS
jgi:hypothetical protein